MSKFSDKLTDFVRACLDDDHGINGEAMRKLSELALMRENDAADTVYRARFSELTCSLRKIIEQIKECEGRHYISDASND